MTIKVGSFFVATGQAAEADALVRRFHYSGRPPGNVQRIVTAHAPGGLFGDFGPAVAAVYFSVPPTRWSEPVWELSRLVRADGLSFPCTSLISVALSLVRNDMDLVVSFADWTQKHHGGIYQAASWNYHGMRQPRRDGLVIGGQFVPGRSLNSRFGTQSAKRLMEQEGIAAEEHWDDGKHLYWKSLGRSGAKKAERLGLNRAPYPKPHADRKATA